MRAKENKNEISFTVLIPVHNEQGSIAAVINGLAKVFKRAGVSDYEILVVDDGSEDFTHSVLKRISERQSTVRNLRLKRRRGFGRAIQTGLRYFRGEAVALVMGDGSENPEDVLLYYEKIKMGAPCVFGSRFLPGSSIAGYPPLKFRLNRTGNWFIRKLFNTTHNDLTNGFKAYRRDVLNSLAPIRSCGFELSVELPLKVLRAGYEFEEVPVSWKGRTSGTSKFGLWKTPFLYLTTALRIRFTACVISRFEF